jgi:hypothetical protein
VEQAAFNAILAALPESQRRSAYFRIVTAESYGYTDIGLWTWTGTADEADLAGITCNGDFAFIPGVDLPEEDCPPSFQS